MSSQAPITTMQSFVDRGEIPGLVTLIARGDEVDVQTFGNLSLGGRPVTRDSIFRIASISKSLSAAAAMILVEEGKLKLDDPVDDLIPELANRRVLRKVDGSLEDTVPAKRPITTRHLLTHTIGLGYLMTADQDLPILKALREINLLQGPPHPQQEPDPDEWIRRVGTIPLMHHPGDQWQYDLGTQVLGVLMARAAGQPLEVFLQERLFGPLGMLDTAFYVPESKIHRFATNYYPSDEGLKVYDEAIGGEWSKPPRLPQSAGGLVSTADDLLSFARMMANGGSHGKIQVLKPETVAQMTTNQVTPAQIAGQEIFLGDAGWGFGMAVRPQGSIPAGYGWDGGLGTSWYNDPEKNLTGILLTQVSWTSPVPPPVRQAFWQHAYQTVA